MGHLWWPFPNLKHQSHLMGFGFQVPRYLTENRYELNIGQHRLAYWFVANPSRFENPWRHRFWL